MKFKTIYDRPLPVVARVSDVLLTSQEFKNECDLNLVVARVKQTTGSLDSLVSQADFSAFKDVSVDLDFVELNNIKESMSNLFNQLSATDRAKYNNDLNVFCNGILNGDFSVKEKTLNTDIVPDAGGSSALSNSAVASPPVETPAA